MPSRGCQLRTIIASASHLLKECSCCGGEWVIARPRGRSRLAPGASQWRLHSRLVCARVARCRLDHHRHFALAQRLFGRLRGHLCILRTNRRVSWGAEAFEVEHFRPRRKFPDLISAYDNLDYVCRKCNFSPILVSRICIQSMRSNSKTEQFNPLRSVDLIPSSKSVSIALTSASV